jgi:hypothetical protein
LVTLTEGGTTRGLSYFPLKFNLSKYGKDMILVRGWLKHVPKDKNLSVGGRLSTGVLYASDRERD